MGALPCEAVEMVEFETAGLLASASLGVDESAAAPIALVDLTPDRGGDGAAHFLSGRCGRGCGLRPSPDREPVLFHFLDQEVERSLDHLGQVIAWDLVLEQILRLAQLVAKLAARGELDLEAFRAERL